MSEVTRYEEGDPCAGMYESSEGVWVHIDDYDQLKAKLDEARELLRYAADECIPSLGREIDAWLEANK